MNIWYLFSARCASRRRRAAPRRIIQISFAPAPHTFICLSISISYRYRLYYVIICSSHMQTILMSLPCPVSCVWIYEFSVLAYLFIYSNSRNIPFFIFVRTLCHIYIFFFYGILVRSQCIMFQVAEKNINLNRVAFRFYAVCQLPNGDRGMRIERSIELTPNASHHTSAA